MKAKIIPLLLAAAMLTACGGSSASGDSGQATEGTETAEAVSSTEEGTESESGPLVSDDTIEYDPADYCTLGEWKGLTLTLTGDYEVTDADIEEEVKTRISQVGTSYKETDKTEVEDGDIVDIDYEGKKDGVAFDGGTAQGYHLTIGSGTFIPGFEDGLIGVKVGETVDLPLTFPEEYHSEELAGQEVVFTVTVNAIVEEEEPELTDEFVTENFQASSVESWKESLRESLESQAASQKETDEREAALKALEETCEVSGFPEGLLEERQKQAKEMYASQAASYGIDLATMLSFYGMTEEDLDSELASTAEENCTQEIILLAIAQEEGLEEGSEEWKAYLADFTGGEEVTEEEIFQSYPEHYLVRLFKADTALDRVVGAATIKEE